MNKLMRLFLLTLLGVSFLFSCQTSEDPSFLPEQEEEAVVTFEFRQIPDRYIILFNENPRKGSSFRESLDLMETYSREFLNENSLESVEVLSTYAGVLNGFVADIDNSGLAAIENDPRIKLIEPDYEIIMNAPPWERGNDGTGSNGEEIPYGISRVNGGVSYTGNSVAWILDSGIDLDHEDLNVDESRGFNAFTAGKDARSLDDGNGHGTHVAGTIAAIDNEVGVIGVAAGATVVPVKVLDSRGSGSYSGVIAGVNYVAENGNPGDVANMSLGGPVSTALDAAVEAAAQKGIRFCLAAGNESGNANEHSPARANGSNVYTVSAMNSNDVWASFSNFGNPPIDYCAPGVGISSLWKNGGYNTISGTSMATPHIAGLLLIGNLRTDGNVAGDPDGNADPIAVH